jgi:hypothetical protein
MRLSVLLAGVASADPAELGTLGSGTASECQICTYDNEEI